MAVPVATDIGNATRVHTPGNYEERFSTPRLRLTDEGIRHQVVIWPFPFMFLKGIDEKIPRCQVYAAVLGGCFRQAPRAELTRTK